MSNLPIDPRLPFVGTPNYQTELNRQLYILLRDIASQLNSLSNSEISAKNNADTSAPTTGTYYQGDFVPNSQPSEAGTAGNKYVIIGWICTASGTPGTWLQCRTLTGN